MKTIVTGAAGFIGFHLCKRLIENNIEVIGIDNFNAYYDTSLKEARHQYLMKIGKKFNSNFKIHCIDIENFEDLKKVSSEFKPERFVNLAAQAGVRYSIENPNSYIKSNLVGFGNVLQICRELEIKNLIYASSSSVYGGNKKMPFKETDAVDHPVSLYAATKKANELMAHTYSHLYDLPCTGLRFFTVYGPWGRPDMALFKFTKAILSGKPIDLYNKGNMIRDFTYIDDVIESIIRLLNKPAKKDESFNNQFPNSARSWAPNMIFNVGNSNPTELKDFIKAIESNLGIESKKNFLPMQAGDVAQTASDNSLLFRWINYKPKMDIDLGIKNFIDWYRDFYGI